MIMKKLKITFQIGMVIILSLFLANCSSSSDKLFDDFDHDPQLKAPHTYDIKLTKGDETIHYTGSVTDEDDALTMILEGKDDDGMKVQYLSLTLEDGPLTITGVFSFDEKGALVPFDHLNEDSEEFSSGIMVSDLEGGIYFMSMSGKPVISNLENHLIAESQGTKVSLISYTLKFNGDFQLINSEDDDVYSATGTIVMSPYK